MFEVHQFQVCISVHSFSWLNNILLYRYALFILIYFSLNEITPIIENWKTQRCENFFYGYQKLEAEKLQRFGSWLCVSFLIRGWPCPCKIWLKNQQSPGCLYIFLRKGRVFSFFLNSEGFDSERIQASQTQQCPPCSHYSRGPSGGLSAPRETVLFLHCGHLSPATVLGLRLNVLGTLALQAGVWVQCPPSCLSPA